MGQTLEGSLIAKAVRFYKSKVKASFSVAKIQFRFKKMFNKNKVCFKAMHYFINTILYFSFKIKLQRSNNNVKCKTKSTTSYLETQGFLFRLSINT